MSAWVPGQSGNPEGGRRPFRDALRRALARAESDNSFKSLNQLAATLISKAADGDITALKEVADRLDGRVPQAIVGDDESPPIAQSLKVEFIGAVPVHD